MRALEVGSYIRALILRDSQKCPSNQVRAFLIIHATPPFKKRRSSKGLPFIDPGSRGPEWVLDPFC